MLRRMLTKKNSRAGLVTYNLAVSKEARPVSEPDASCSIAAVDGHSKLLLPDGIIRHALCLCAATKEVALEAHLCARIQFVLAGSFLC